MSRELPDSPEVKASDGPEAVKRILASETFRRADRLKELLTYLAERTANAPEAAMREQDIGAEVYGRERNYDTSHDTIVRVQVAQLRKRLERYYEAEGVAESLLLTIPRGRYQVQWTPRAAVAVSEVSPPITALEPEVGLPEQLPEVVTPPHRPGLWLGVAVGLIAVVAIAFLLNRREPKPAAGTAVTQLWSQLLVPGRQTHVVLSDPGLVQIANVTRQRVPFAELADGRFLRRIDAFEEGPFRSLLGGVMGSQLTTLSDVEIVRRITALGLSDPGLLNIVVARDFRVRELNNQNTILVGYNVSNPWVDVFSQSMNFVMESGLENNGMSIANRRPQAGEESRYWLGNPRVVNPAQGYAVVAFLPNPAAAGKTLIVSGADVPGTEVAIRFLMNEEQWEPFFRKIAAQGRVPWFEVLLGYRRLSNSAGDLQPVAWRVHSELK